MTEADTQFLDYMIKALVDNGIVTGEQLLNTPDSVWIPIAMSGLQW